MARGVDGGDEPERRELLNPPFPSPAEFARLMAQYAMVLRPKDRALILQVAASLLPARTTVVAAAAPMEPVRALRLISGRRRSRAVHHVVKSERV